MSSKTSSRPRSGPPPTAPPSNGKQPNAWSRPLQPAAKKPQKVARPPPGMGAPPVLRERFLHLTLSMVGQKVVVTCTDGSVVEGIFHTFTPFSTTEINYVLRACHGDGVKQHGATVILDAQNVAHVSVKSMRLDTNNNNNISTEKSQFQTDVQISATKQDRNRDLVAAGSAWTSTNSRADNAPKTTFLKGDIGGWDQFKANEQLFNVQATFDENLYTTELDHSQIDARKKLEAARLAREIETTTSSNIHLKEERGQAVEGDYDEEDLYSGVLKPSLQPRNVLVVEKSSRSQQQQQQQQVLASKKEGGDAKGKEPKTTTAAGPKKMNYAAAAAKAKADANKAAVVPPGFVKPNVVTPEQQESGATNKKEEKKQEENGDAKVTPSKEEPAKEEKKVDETKSDENKEETKKPTTKLNANAKSFSFNPGAKSFTPTFGGAPPPAAAAAAPQYEQYPIDPNTGIPFGGPGGALPQHMQPQYMPHPEMGQPGMVQMMNPHYAAAMRYQGPYPGMEHQMPMPVPHQPQHMQQQPPSAPGSQHPSAPGSQQASEHGSVAGADSPAPPMSGDDASDSAAPPLSQQQQQQQQQTFNQHLQQMPYPGGPPGNYYHPGMMPRGAPGVYPPQAMAHPPGNPYMHPMYVGGGGGAPGGMHHQMPPNMMRQGGPPGSYYPPTTMGGMHYPPGAYGGGGGVMMEDDPAGYNRGSARGGRSGGARGGGPRRGSSGRKNRGYSSYSSGGGSGRQTPQSVTSGMSADAGDTGGKSSSTTEEKQPKPSGEE